MNSENTQFQRPVYDNYPPQQGQYYPPQGQYPNPPQQYYVPQGQYPNPQYYAPPVQQPTRIPPLRKAATTRDLIFAVIFAILSVLSADFYLWGNAGLGAAITTSLLYISALVYLTAYRCRITPYGIFCGIAYLAGASSLVFSNIGFLKFLLAICLMILGTVSIMEAMGLRSSRDSSYRTLGDFFYTGFALTFGSIGRCIYALFHKKNSNGANENRKVGVALIGAACSLPLLIIIVPLLMSSDEAFSNLLEKLALDNIGEISGALVFGLAAFLLIFGRLFSAPLMSREKKEATRTNGIVPAAICSCMGMIAVVYVLYLVSQLAYFFSAFSGLLPENFTVAEYARQGFFEMCVVCAINLGIIFLATLLCKKDKPAAPLAIRLFSLFFCLFSMVLIATALSKMFLYIDSFGMTHLRIYTSVFMIFLAVVFLAVAVRLFVWKVPYMKIATVTAAVLLIATCFANVDGVVAQYNVTAYKTGKLDSIDMETLQVLDRDSAVPWLLELMDDEDSEVAERATRLLYQAQKDHFLVRVEYEDTYENNPISFRSYNAVYAKAHELLWEHRDAIVTAYDKQ